jgi:hypothetical protein
MLVLSLQPGGQKEFLAWDDQIGTVILGRLHWLQVEGILLYVMSHLLMSTIWDVIPYQYLNNDSWPLYFLIPHIVPINIYLCPLMIFVGVLTTKVTEPCSLKSWFILRLTMRTTMLRLDPHPFADGLLETLHSTPKTDKETIVNLYLPRYFSTSPLYLAQACVW